MFWDYQDATVSKPKFSTVKEWCLRPLRHRETWPLRQAHGPLGKKGWGPGSCGDSYGILWVISTWQWTRITPCVSSENHLGPSGGFFHHWLTGGLSAP